MRVYPHTNQQKEWDTAGIDLETYIAIEFAKAEISNGVYYGPSRALERAEEFVERLKE